MKRAIWTIVIAVEVAVVGVIGWLLLESGRGPDVGALPATATVATTPNAQNAPVAPRKEPDYFAAADKGDAEAAYMLGEAFRLGDRVPKNERVALAWYSKSAAAGFPAAQFRMWEAYSAGQYGAAKDMPMALDWLRKAAWGGDAEAQYQVGRMRLSGAPGMAAVAYFWLKRSTAAQGHGEAAKLRETVEMKTPPERLSLFPVPSGAGIITFRTYTFNSAGRKNFAAQGVKVVYRLAWPVSGCSSKALHEMRRCIAETFLDVTYDEQEMPSFTAEGLRNPLEWMVLPAKALVGEVHAGKVLGGDKTEGRTLSVVYQGAGVVSCEFLFENGFIGIHDSSYAVPLTFNAKTGRRLVLVDVFKPGSEAALAVAIRKAIRIAYKIPAGERLDAQGFFDADEGIKPTQNFSLTADSVVFSYWRYEIGVGCVGNVVVDVPLEDVAGILRADGPGAAIWAALKARVQK